MTIIDKPNTAGGQGGSLSQEHGAGVGIMAEQMMQETAGKMIPTGYKQTEVGVIPEDWSVLAISDRHEIATGNTPPTADACNYGADYLFIGPGDLGSGKYVFSSMKMLSSKGFKLARKFPAGSTLFTCIGSTIGKTGYVVDVATSNQQINAVFPNELDDSEFTYYALTNIAPKVKELAGEQAVPLVNKKDFGEMKYCLPTNKQEQIAIANVLSDSDALIDALEQLIAKKQAIKSATMQQLLTGRTRLPAFALRPDGTPKGYKPSELGDIPEDWEVNPLGDLCSLKSGLGITSKDIDDSSAYRCFGGNGLRGYTQKYTHDGNYVLIGRQGALCGNIQYVSGRFFASEHALVATLSKFSNAMWLAVYLERMNLNQYSESSAQPGLSAEKLRILKLITPTNEEQTAIATILSDMDNELQTLTQKLEKARALKQGMMQQLLTGKIRLIKPSKEVIHE